MSKWSPEKFLEGTESKETPAFPSPAIPCMILLHYLEILPASGQYGKLFAAVVHAGHVPLGIEFC
jgi:hypothetical protein